MRAGHGVRGAQVVQRVEVGKGLRVVGGLVEGDDRRAVLRAPVEDAAPARLQTALQAARQRGAQQAKHRLGLQAQRAQGVALGCRNHGQIGLLRLQGVRKSLAKR